VLHLLETAHRCTSWWITVGEQPPTARKPLGVLRVSPEHSHLQWASGRVVSDELGRADPLSLRHAQVVHDESEADKREANPLCRGHPRRGPEHEPHKRSRTETHRQSSEDLRHRAHAQDNRAECRQRHEPGGEEAHRPDKFWPRNG
jgi:hypothetical protein